MKSFKVAPVSVRLGKDDIYGDRYGHYKFNGRRLTLVNIALKLGIVYKVMRQMIRAMRLRDRVLRAIKEEKSESYRFIGKESESEDWKWTVAVFLMMVIPLILSCYLWYSRY